MSNFQLSQKGGVLFAEIESPHASLEGIFVYPQVRENGVGSELLQLFEQACLQASVKWITGKFRPTVSNCNPADVERFYLKRGYQILEPTSEGDVYLYKNLEV